MTDVFRTPDERFAALPGFSYRPHYITWEDLRLHHVDEGDGPPVVCFHGEPSWAYLYRKMIGPLVDAHHRVICPDYPGFGRSDKPTEIGWYTYERFVAAVTHQLAALNLRDVTVVVQDWGGPIGLRWAVEHADRVRALVILNTGLFTGQVSEGFLRWRSFAQRTGTDLPVGQVLQGATATELSDEVLAAYEAPFPSAQAKAGAAAFPLLVPVAGEDPGAAEMRAVSDALARWNKPALVAFSDSDPVFVHPQAGRAFVDLLPTVDEQVTVEGAAHFLQEDRGARIAGRIAAFLTNPRETRSDLI